VTISARSGARSASHAEASTSSPIISGLIALSASGRSRVRVPISPSISIESVFRSGGLGAVVVVIGGSLLGGRRSLDDCKPSPGGVLGEAPSRTFAVSETVNVRVARWRQTDHLPPQHPEAAA
jgi:hypothetical protein